MGEQLREGPRPFSSMYEFHPNVPQLRPKFVSHSIVIHPFIVICQYFTHTSTHYHSFIIIIIMRASLHVSIEHLYQSTQRYNEFTKLQANISLRKGSRQYKKIHVKSSTNKNTHHTQEHPLPAIGMTRLNHGKDNAYLPSHNRPFAYGTMRTSSMILHLWPSHACK